MKCSVGMCSRRVQVDPDKTRLTLPYPAGDLRRIARIERIVNDEILANAATEAG